MTGRLRTYRAHRLSNATDTANATGRPECRSRLRQRGCAWHADPRPCRCRRQYRGALDADIGPGVEIVVTEGLISIGRRPGNTIVISNDAYISGRHAQIETDNTGTYLTDVGSTNGTSVNGQKMTAGERQLLLEGDEVQMGQTKYVYALRTGAGRAPSVPITPSFQRWTPCGNPATDGSPPGQEFGAINDPCTRPTSTSRNISRRRQRGS